MSLNTLTPNTPTFNTLTHNTAKILIIDDNDAQLLILKEILCKAGYTRLTTLKDPRQIESFYDICSPDLILLDVHMPHRDGFEVLAILQTLIPSNAYLPILMLTSDMRLEVKQKALASGAKDFLAKPYAVTEVHLRVKNLLETRLFYLQQRFQQDRLEQAVRERTKQLEQTQMQLEQTQVEMLTRLAHAAEYRDDETGEHVWRVAQTAWLIAQELNLSEERATLLLRAARLHDVGKIGIPEPILLKPGKLTPEEFALVKEHTTIGAKLLSGGESPLLKLAETIALTHHENWDGSGYPRGLRAEAIPLEGRILAVADTFDALTHDRIHQKAWTPAEAAYEIEAHRGRRFDPSVVEAFVRVFKRGDLAFQRSSQLPKKTSVSSFEPSYSVAEPMW
jgi:putative two-component system response regulator